MVRAQENDLAKMTYPELVGVCRDIRNKLIDYFSSHGGHVATNLGAVELVVSALKEYAFEGDSFLFDIGNQAYALKLLTRRELPFDSIRTLGGQSGFQAKAENPRDLTIGGHAGVALAYAVGLLRSLDRKPQPDTGPHNVLCFIGDASLAEGCALEALNAVMPSKGARLVLVVNDNRWGIDPTTGSLSRILLSPDDAKLFFALHGLDYVHCSDGNDLSSLQEAWATVKRTRNNIVLHAHTHKGAGLPVAEAEPTRFHYQPPFDPHTGQVKDAETRLRYVDLNSEILLALKREGHDVVVIATNMCAGNGLEAFRRECPADYLDVGICEQLAVAMSCGVALAGRTPVIAMHCSFLPRAFDQVFHDVCLQGNHVVLLGARHGLNGPDGPSHHAMFDLSYLRCLPNLAIYAPRDLGDYAAAVRHAVVRERGPILVLSPHRFEPRPKSAPTDGDLAPLDVMATGDDALVVCTGSMCEEGRRVRELLAARGASVGLVHVRRVKPFDAQAFGEIARRHRLVAVLEENSRIGGIGSEIASLLAAGCPCPEILQCGAPDEFIPHGDIPGLRDLAGLSAATIAPRIEQRLAALARRRSSQPC